MSTIRMLVLANLLAYPGWLLASDIYHPSEGDLIFQSLPKGDLVNAIEGATDSPYSHVGMVIKRDSQWYVREALGAVSDTDLHEFLRRGRQGAFDVYRLTAENQHFVPVLIEESDKYLGRPYDIRYRMDDSEIYCSELIYKAFLDATGMTLGEIVTLGSLDWGEYEKLIIFLENGPVPTDREMITPRDLAEAEQLELVHSGY